MRREPGRTGTTADADRAAHTDRAADGNTAADGDQAVDGNQAAGSDRAAGPDVDGEFQAYMAARWPALVRTAYLLTGDQHLAEDLAQAALTKVYASWRRVRRADDVDAYVRRILVNTNAGWFRKRRVREHLTAAPYDARAQHEPHEGLAQRSALMAALAELPARQRAVVVLRYWEDLSERAVADALGCAPGTVKSQAAKALAKLRASAALGDRRPAGPGVYEQDPVTVPPMRKVG